MFAGKAFGYTDLPGVLNSAILHRVDIDSYLRLLKVNHGLRQYALTSGPFSRSMHSVHYITRRAQIDATNRLWSSDIDVYIDFRDAYPSGGPAAERNRDKCFQFYWSQPSATKTSPFRHTVVPISERSMCLFKQITMSRFFSLTVQGLDQVRAKSPASRIEVIHTLPRMQSVADLNMDLLSPATVVILDHFHPTDIRMAEFELYPETEDELQCVERLISTHFSDNCHRIQVSCSSADIFKVLIATTDKRTRILEFGMAPDEDYKEFLSVIVRRDTSVGRSAHIIVRCHLEHPDDIEYDPNFEENFVQSVEKLLLDYAQPLSVDGGADFDSHFRVDDKMDKHENRNVASKKFYKIQVDQEVESLFRMRVFKDPERSRRNFVFNKSG